MKQRSKVLRPVAWVATLVMFTLMDFVSSLVCRLGEWAVGEFNNLSTGMIIILVLLLGSIYVSLFFYSAFLGSSLLVYASERIYPTHHAFRYYFIGIISIILCALSVLAGILSWVRSNNGGMFWYYAKYVHIMITVITMMYRGRDESIHHEAVEDL